MKVEPDPILLQFWGKTPKTGAPPEQFHPAIFHMLDVAFVAEALLHDGAPRLRRAMHHAWRGCDPDALVAWLPFLIATHDLGKISAAFQGQVDPQRERLACKGVTFTSRKINLYHAEVSALWLHEFLQGHEPGTADSLMWALRDAMGGHHGRFIQDEMRKIRQNQIASERGEPRWVVWREQTYALLRERLAPRGDMAVLGAPQQIRPATAALTGFIIWCDWMGSNERDFSACPDQTLEQYMVTGRERVTKALSDHALRHVRSAPKYTGFRSLFPDPPRPLQTLIDQLPADQVVGPLLAVIEAPTGEGKTEAALALARRIAARSEIDEIFFALPTMATGNQMFLRLEDFYRKHYGADGAVRLTHSQSLVIEPDLRRRVVLSHDSDSSDREGRSADAALEWFVGPKKAMLAPFGVGTVDQVELAGLNVRHYVLRLFGLAGKVVVIDEIHAYDAYMSTILAHTLSWLASLGCSVILLSATLPAARHRDLAEAFLGGIGEPAPPTIPADVPYPALSLYRAGAQLRETCAVFRGEQRFTMRFVAPRTTPAEEARYLLNLVQTGGAVARLCNRVDDAQAIYRELKAIDADHRVLLHARFPLEQRQKNEGRIEELLGKKTTRSADQPLIIVGTQVLEQSLDYDVDVMVSDFAPIDLLLQRAGRLHRHDRSGKRPLRHTAPVLEVTLPYDEERKPDWDRWKMIYHPYILWRSLATLAEGMADDQREIVLPRDYRPLIEAVYGEDSAAVGGIYAGEIAKARAHYLREVAEQQGQGRQPLTPDVTSNVAIIRHGGFKFIDDESGQEASWQLAKTRLGDRVTLVPVYQVDGKLCLDAGGTWEIDRDIRPDMDRQKELLNRAVPVSDRRVIAAYRDEKRDRKLCWPWPERELPPLLRSLHPLPLDPRTHRIVIEGRTLRLDTDLGLVIEKADPRSGVIIEEDL
jgi:CRISPR-associated endonuclease/helicase Cas3